VLCRVADLMNTNFNFPLLWFCILLMFRFTVNWQFVFSSFGILLMFGFTDYCQKVKILSSLKLELIHFQKIGVHLVRNTT